MKLKAILVSIFFTLNPNLLLADKYVDSCMARKPFVFGASISAGYSGFVDGLLNKAKAMTPLDYFLAKISEISNVSLEPRREARVRGGWYFQDTLGIIEHPDFDHSSLIVTLDAFYWDSIDGEAHSNVDRTCQNSISTLEALIEKTKENQQTLVIGNIPEEDGKTVPWHVKKASNWREPYETCRIDFNNKLSSICHSEEGCHLIDIDLIVKGLNSSEGLFVEKVSLFNQELDEGRYFRDDFRKKDGVHLTDQGSIFLADLIAGSIISQNEKALNCQIP